MPSSNKALPVGTPTRAWTKDALIQASEERGIAVDTTDGRPILWVMLGPHVAATGKPVVVQMAEAAGHEAIFTPPRYSNHEARRVH